MARPPVPLVTEAAVTTSALTTISAITRLGEAARALVARGAATADLREAAYVASLFCGFPRGVAALVALAELADGGCHRQPPPATREATRTSGEAVFREIHQRNAGRQLRLLTAIHPDFADTVLTEAYGRVLARPFLPLAVRELVGATALAVMGLGPQLRAHLLGAHNAGAGWPEVEAAVRLGLEVAEADPRDAIAQLTELRARLAT